MSDRINWPVFLTRKFWKLLAGVLWSALKVALPLALVFLLPPWASLVYWMLSLICERIEFSRRGTITISDMWMFAANLSIAAAAMRVLPDGWFHWPGVVVALIAAFALSEWLRVVLRMPRSPKESAGESKEMDAAKTGNGHLFPLEALPMLERSYSAPALNPGDRFTLAGTIRVKVLDVVEERFGPPRDVDYLIDSQVLLPGCSASSRLLASPDGRYIVSVIAYGDGTMIFDRHEDMLYRVRTQVFWVLYSMDDRSLTGIGRKTDVPPQRAKIADMIAVAEKDPLVSVDDFKVPRSYREHALKWGPDIGRTLAPHAIS
jgi:hypothetical protein